MTLADRIADVRREMDEACGRVGRDPASARLLVVSKSAHPDLFAELKALEVRDLGENRIQGAAGRLAGYERSFRWHFIGHLQSNKVRKAVPLFDVFHGVDSVDLLQRLDRVAGELGRHPELLLQVNVSGEGSKSGLSPAELPVAVALGAELKHARLIGLMTMAPRAPDAEQARPIFRELADLRASLAAEHPGLTELSMGMTSDFRVAIEEGATWVRVGSRIVASVVRGVD